MSLTAKNKNNITTYIDNAIEGEMYYCPVCNQPMIQKRGEERIHHFAHLSPHGRPDIVPCSDHWHYCKTEWHCDWQKRFPVDCMERVLEYKGNKHIADVLVDKYVVEFQHSPISLEEFNERNEFYTQLGYKVIWVFDLTEEYDDGRFAQDSFESEWYYKWSNPKKLFKEMIFADVKATMFIQLGDDDDGESCVLERITSIYHEGKHISTSKNNALTIKEFVDMIGENSEDVFEKPKPAPAPDSITNCKSVVGLWKESYSSMIIKNKHNSNVIRVFGKEGHLVRDYQTGRIRCRYQYLDKYTGFYKDKDGFYNVFDEDKEIWTLVQSFHDKDYEERVAQRKREAEEQEAARKKYLDETRPYRGAERDDCKTLHQLVRFSVGMIFVENVYTGKIYRVDIRSGSKAFEIYEVKKTNICLKLTGELSNEVENQFNFKIWRIYC